MGMQSSQFGDMCHIPSGPKATRLDQPRLKCRALAKDANSPRTQNLRAWEALPSELLMVNGLERYPGGALFLGRYVVVKRRDGCRNDRKPKRNSRMTVSRLVLSKNRNPRGRVASGARQAHPG
jgi:hypothetical protein